MRHHCGKHPNRGRSNYKARLLKRGLSKAPALQRVEDLRKMQLARLERTGSLWPSRTEMAGLDEETAVA